jgi:hypothetical protein
MQNRTKFAKKCKFFQMKGCLVARSLGRPRRALALLHDGTGRRRNLPRLLSPTAYPARHVWLDASVHQIWVIDASARTDALSTRVLPRGSRPRMAAAQRVGAMLVKGWPRCLTFRVSPVALFYAAALADCCVARCMARSLQCRCLGLHADIQCLGSF